jgi:hypothetical protein
MPRTAYGIDLDETFAKRSAIVRAAPTDREEIRSTPHQQDLLVADMAEQLPAIGELGKRNALLQIGAAG